MRRIAAFILIIVAAGNIFGQDSLNLFVVRQAAWENFPLQQQVALYDEMYQIRVEQLNKNYLPSLQVNGQIHYQSDVTKIPLQNLPISGIEPLEKDWYKVSLDLSQTIYDGGVTKALKEAENIDLEINREQFASAQLNLTKQIDNLYFAVLTLFNNKKVLQLHEATLESRLKEVKAAVEEGLLTIADQRLLEAEMIRVQTSVSDLQIQLQAARQQLESYTGMPLPDVEQWMLPSLDTAQKSGINRPELNLIALQQQALDSRNRLNMASTRPRLAAFGQAGYGRPGLDMLKNQFDDYYLIGAKLSWNLWDWRKAKTQREWLEVKKQLLERERDYFNQNLSAQLIQARAKILEAENRMKNTREIINVRQEVTSVMAAQLREGTITSSRYITELNAETAARLELSRYRVEYARAIADYLTTTGNIK